MARIKKTAKTIKQTARTTDSQDAYLSLVLLHSMRRLTEFLPWEQRLPWWQDVHQALDSTGLESFAQRWNNFLHWILIFVFDNYLPSVEYNDATIVLFLVLDLFAKDATDVDKWASASLRCHTAALHVDYDMEQLYAQSKGLPPQTEGHVLNQSLLRTANLQCMVGLIAKAMADIRLDLSKASAKSFLDEQELEALVHNSVTQLFLGLFNLNELLKPPSASTESSESHEKLAAKVAAELLKCMRWVQ